MKNSMKIAFCGITTALSIVLMFMGGIVPLFIYIMPMLASILMIVIKRSFSASAAWITYTATSILSFILVADRECMLMYVMFFGFYPIIKDGLDKIKSKVLCIFIKLLIFNILMAGVQLVLIYLFKIPFSEENSILTVLLLFIVLLNVLFVTYDFVLNKMIIFYVIKVEPRIKKLLK